MTMKMMRMSSRYLKLLSEAEAAAPLLKLLLLLLLVVVVVVVVVVVGIAAVLLKQLNLYLNRRGQVLRAPGG
jgi:flagellar basal body-associated protein FliL